jgi:protein-disulfide isomerase
MAGNENERLTKNERRQQAREKARLAREKERKRQKRNRLLWQGGIVVVVIAVVVVVGLVVANSFKPAGPGPKNMATGGVTLQKDLKVKKTKALPNDAQRQEPFKKFDKKPLPVQVFFDFTCPACGNFEQTYGNMLEQYTGSGDIELDLYPITFLDAQSQGTKYSSRASNMFGCVVDQQPKYTMSVYQKLFDEKVQPDEGSAGLTDDELLDQAKAAGVDTNGDFKSCVKSKQFMPFFQANTKQVLEKEVLGLQKGARLQENPQTGKMQPANQAQRLVSTPLILVNGKQWVSNEDGDLESYILKQLQNADANESEGKDAKKSDNKKTSDKSDNNSSDSNNNDEKDEQ